jgi:GNAT superfamily N-acetyltransferase
MKIEFRRAGPQDLDRMLELLPQIDILDESLTKKKSDFRASRETYAQVFEDILRDPNNEFIVGVIDERVVAMLQLTYIRGLFFGTNRRAMVEDVRIEETFRGQGLGSKLMHFAFERARGKGCQIFQLTTNHWRTDSIDFYKKLGMHQSHIGFRMKL